MASDYWRDIRTDAQALGMAVRQVRLAMMLSQPDLIASLGGHCDVPTLSRIEAGTLIPYNQLAETLSSWLLMYSSEETLADLAIPSTRSHDPQTSHDAARSVSATTLRDLHRWWLRHLALMWRKDPDQLNLNGDPHGYFSTDEGARKFYDGKVSDSGFRTRRAELRHADLVEDSGLRYPISTGRLAIAWRLTPSGYLIIKETPP